MNRGRKLTLKIVLVIVAITALSTSAHAQGIGSFFNQNAKQKEYLLQQIAALKVYDIYLEKGYSIAKKGTSVISAIKNNDLSLHTGHIDSLKTVSVSVQNYSRVKGTIQLQQQIVSSHNKVYRQLTKINRLTAKELTDFNIIYHAILLQSQTSLEELRLVTTNGKLSMTDNDRIARIDKLYKEMLDLYGKEQKINNHALALAAQRNRESKDNKILKRLYQ